MPRHVAFLRAINVGGHVVKMDRLRQLFEALGFSGVATHIASGNVHFSARSAGARSLEAKIEAALETALGYEVATFLRTPAELAAIEAYEAFPAAEAAASHGVYVGFLKEPLAADQVRLVEGLGTPNDVFAFHGREIHWLCRERSEKSIALPGKLEKSLRLRATFRNVTTVKALVAQWGRPQSGPPEARSRSRRGG